VAHVQVPAPPTMVLFAVSPMGQPSLWPTKLARRHSADRFGECRRSVDQLADWERPVDRAPPGPLTAKELFTPMGTIYSWQGAMAPNRTSLFPRPLKPLSPPGRLTVA